MIKKIVYKTNIMPNHLTLHALFATIIDNKHINQEKLEYKIYYKDKQVILIINTENCPELKLQQCLSFRHNDNIIKLIKIREEPFEYIPFKNDTVVRLTGTICYSIHKSTENVIKHVCPINLNGNFIKGTREHTLNYLNDKMGINLFDERFARTNRFEAISSLNFNNPLSKTNNNKIIFYNVFSFDVVSFVNDIKKLNKLNYCSIGRKRNYGFGNIFIAESGNSHISLNSNK